MKEKSFSKDYEIQQEIKNFHTYMPSPPHIYQVVLKNALETQYPCISVHFNQNIDFELFQKLRRFKYIGVFQPETYYDEKEYILIYLNYLDNQLNKNKLLKLKEEEQQINLNREEGNKISHANRIVLQLAFLFAELEQRNYKWPLEYLEQLYYIDGLLYISLADYDFNSPNLQNSCFQQFKKFIQNHFPEQFEDIRKISESLAEIVEHLVKTHIKGYNDCDIPNENVFKDLLFYKQEKNQIKFQLLSHGNSIVKEFTPPPNLVELHPVLYNQEQVCIYKVTRNFGNEENQKRILQRMDREIQIMEENESNYLVVCSLYFRVNETPFLIMKKYPYTLFEFLKSWNPTPENLKKDVYAFSYKFATALKDFHSQNYQHRDLKPDNLFLNKSDLEESDVFIADFDRSKKNDVNMVEQTAQNLQNQKFYSPPEEKVFEEKQYTYDVFQYGMIVLQMANRGKYIGDDKRGTWLLFYDKQSDQYYGSKAINDALSQYNYDQDFVNLIIQCLKENPKGRPSSEIILKITQNLFQSVKPQQQILQQVEPKQQNQKLIQQQQEIPQKIEQVQIQDQDLENKIKKLQEFLKGHFEKENKQQ